MVLPVVHIFWSVFWRMLVFSEKMMADWERFEKVLFAILFPREESRIIALLERFEKAFP